jgi:hypothetical protein
LNVHAPTEDEAGNTKDRIYEELELPELKRPQWRYACG